MTTTLPETEIAINTADANLNDQSAPPSCHGDLPTPISDSFARKIPGMLADIESEFGYASRTKRRGLNMDSTAQSLLRVAHRVFGALQDLNATDLRR